MTDPDFYYSSYFFTISTYGVFKLTATCRCEQHTVSWNFNYDASAVTQASAGMMKLRLWVGGLCVVELVEVSYYPSMSRICPISYEFLCWIFFHLYVEGNKRYSYLCYQLLPSNPVQWKDEACNHYLGYKLSSVNRQKLKFKEVKKN